MSSKKINININKSVSSSSSSSPNMVTKIAKTLFLCFSVFLFTLLGVIVSLFFYQHISGERLAFHAHKEEAYFLYSIIASRYDKIINPWHWTVPMRDEAFTGSKLPLWARNIWNSTDATSSSSSSAPSSPMKIIDVGAGTGFFTEGIVLATAAANNANVEITMLDQSDHQLAEAKRKAVLNQTKKIIGDSHDLPFPDMTFDRWTSSGSVEYWPNPRRAIDEAFRVLKPNGISVLVGPARPTHWLAKLIADYWYLFPDADEYRLWYEQAGFEKVDIIELNPEWYGPTDRQYGLIMGFIVLGKKSSDPQGKATKWPIRQEVWKNKVNFMNGNTEYSPSVLRENMQKKQEQQQQAQQDSSSSSFLKTVFAFGRFLLGGIGALYYTFLPIFIALKTTGFGVGDNYPDLIQPPQYMPAIGNLADYIFGFVVAELIWIFVSLHLETPDKADECRRCPQSLAVSGKRDSFLHSVYRLARPHTIKGTFVAIVVGYLLSATFTLNYTDHIVAGLHILVSGILVNIYIVALNQLTDIEIDIENNKMSLPLVTGDMSWNTAKHITHVTFVLASAIGLGGVNATWWIGVIMTLALLGTLYSIPPYRFKQYSSTAAASIALARGVVAIIGGVATLLEVFEVDQERDLQNFPVWPMGFTFSAILLVFCTVIAISKDVPDVQGDKKANINTLAIRFGAANLMKVSYFTLAVLYSAIVCVFTFYQNIYRMDVVSLVGFHLLALGFLIVKSPSNLSSSKSNKQTSNDDAQEKKIALDFYMNVIWPLFYWELVAFPIPCLIEILRYRDVIAVSSASSSISIAVVIAVVAPIVLTSLVKEQFSQFKAVADKIKQVKSIKNQICQHVLNDKELADRNLNGQNDDEAIIFSSPKIRQEVDQALTSTSSSSSSPNNNNKAMVVKQSIEEDNRNVRQDITNLIGLQELSVFHEAANHIFKNPGKMIRSRIITLLARALIAAPISAKNTNNNNNNANANILQKSLILAVCTEMSHSASLLHDDVVDESDIRRGEPSTAKAFGNKLAILSGDYLFSRALRHLAVNVQNAEVTANVAQVLENLTKGEVVQMSPNGNPILSSSSSADQEKKNHEKTIQDILGRYWVKTYLKTASLFALTCKSVACIVTSENNNNNNAESQQEMKFFAEAFGRHFGMAFQLIDDLYDIFSADEDDSTVGKAAGQDLKLGLATLPVIIAAKKHPKILIPLILRNFSVKGDDKIAMDIVNKTKEDRKYYVDEAQKYIQAHVKKAIGCLMHFPKSEWRDELVEVVGKYKLY